MDVHYSSKAHDWETPQAFFDKINAEFKLNLDVCATPQNAKLPLYIQPQQDALSRSWDVLLVDDLGSCAFERPARCWMNPPYGRQIGKWVRKAFEESRRGCLVVCLVPSRTDTSWWHDYCMKGEVRFVRGRLLFGNGSGTAPERGERAPFPSALVIFHPYEVWTNGRDLFAEPRSVDPFTCRR